MNFIRSDWGRGTACALAMALVLLFRDCLNFVVAALLLRESLFFFRRAFEELERDAPTEVVIAVPAVRDGGVPAARGS